MRKSASRVFILYSVGKKHITYLHYLTVKVPETPASTHRLQGFSDAVFAFACTLLVVSLEAPKNFAELTADLRGFVAFGLAFAMLIQIWSAHHKLFRRFPIDDAWAVFLNACLLFTVLLFVYPLKFLAVGVVGNVFGFGGHVDQGINSKAQLAELFIFYGIAFASVFGLIAALYMHANRTSRRAGLQSEALVAADQMRHYLVLSAVGCLSILCSALGIGLQYGLPGWIYTLLGPAAWVNGVLTGRRQRRASSPP